ncbi:MAG: hypothetical protein ACM3PZ_02260 [Bacillota bacterium]
MEKEELIRRLKESAIGSARIEKKSRQFKFAIIPLPIILLAEGFIINSEIVFPCICLTTLLYLFLLVLAPAGKISEEKIHKYFQKKLSDELEDVQQELDLASVKKSYLEEEIRLLNEV